jgi:hypothetical protein
VLLVAGGIAAGLAVPWGDRGSGDRDPAARDREARSLAGATDADDDRGVGAVATRDVDAPALAGAAASSAAGRRTGGRAVVTGRVWRNGRPTAATVELRRVGDVRPESLRTGGDPLDRRVWVLAMGSAGPALRLVTTDARGGFAVSELVAGVYEGRVTIGGTTQAQPVVVRREGEHVEARIEWIDGTEALDVTVRAADGGPAAATVALAFGDGWAWTRGPRARRTDAAGRVRFEGVPAGSVTVVAAVDGEAGVREVVAVEVPRSGEAEVGPAARTVALASRGGVVTGRVTRAGSAGPVANVWVHATAARKDASFTTYPSRSAPTDAEGRFRIEGLGVGWVTVFVQGDGFLSVGLERVRDDADDPLARRTDAAGVLDVALEVVEAAPVVGRVVDPAGRPIAGARVELDPSGVGPDADGAPSAGAGGAQRARRGGLGRGGAVRVVGADPRARVCRARAGAGLRVGAVGCRPGDGRGGGRRHAADDGRGAVRGDPRRGRRSRRPGAPRSSCGPAARGAEAGAGTTGATASRVGLSRARGLSATSDRPPSATFLFAESPSRCR